MVKPMRAVATYPDYEDADIGRVRVMREIITANGGDIVAEAGGDGDNEYLIAFRYSILDEYNRIEALGADEGWELTRR